MEEDPIKRDTKKRRYNQRGILSEGDIMRGIRSKDYITGGKCKWRKMKSKKIPSEGYII